jgi:hypothetical protein
MAKSDRTISSRVQIWWASHDKILLRIAAGLMAFAALVWLSYEFYRLLWQPAQLGGWQVYTGAIDLQKRHRVVNSWFAGKPVYATGYPPASHAIFWLVHGWLDVGPATWIWAATTIGALGWLVYLVVCESGARRYAERFFVALMPLSMYATGATIGNGQLIVHLLPALLAGILLLSKGRPQWRKDLLAAGLILVSLVKPTISVPFFWIVLFIPGRLRPALLVSLGYIVLTLFASMFQEPGLIDLFRSWLTSGLTWSGSKGHAHLYNWLTLLGLGAYSAAASLLILVALGLWTYYYRHVDLWLLLGVTGLVTRFWTYHRWYDDLLILLPMVALFRIVKQGSSADRIKVLAGTLLGISMLASIAPGGLYLMPPPWNMLYVRGQIVVWVVMLIFLLNRSRQQKKELVKMAASKEVT